MLLWRGALVDAGRRSTRGAVELRRVVTHHHGCATLQVAAVKMVAQHQHEILTFLEGDATGGAAR
jgi:hypothetical protein